MGIVSKKAFIDTSPFIYYLNEDGAYAEKMERLFAEMWNQQTILCTSTITVSEYLVMPYRMKNKEKEDSFFEFIEDAEIDVIRVDTEIAKKAASLRAEHKGLKTADAIQLAAAEITGCDLFLTNDKQLKQFKGVQCMLIDEYE